MRLRLFRYSWTRYQFPLQILLTSQPIHAAVLLLNWPVADFNLGVGAHYVTTLFVLTVIELSQHQSALIIKSDFKKSAGQRIQLFFEVAARKLIIIKIQLIAFQDVVLVRDGITLTFIK